LTFSSLFYEKLKHLGLKTKVLFTMPRSSSRFQFSERFNRWRTVVKLVHGDYIDTLCLSGCIESLYCEDLSIRTSDQCLSLVNNLNTYFLELGRQTLATYAEAERVFSVRRNEGGGKDYYIKWRNLSYCEATWEDELKKLYKKWFILFTSTIFLDCPMLKVMLLDYNIFLINRSNYL